jgi:predicted esterase
VTTGPHEHHLTVPKTARYFTLGTASPETRAVWFVVHGYGHLAGDFLARFAPVASAERLIVAPEALNRYYLDTRPGASATSAVGATWMTKEDRQSEIADQVTYLDTLYDAVFRDVPRETVKVTVIGFSQGVPTVTRWLSRSRIGVDRVVCWAGAIPDDVSWAHESALKRADLVMVAGTRDEYATSTRIAQQVSLLNAAGKTFTPMEFDGGHRLDDTGLAALAAYDDQA